MTTYTLNQKPMLFQKFNLSNTYSKRVFSGLNVVSILAPLLNQPLGLYQAASCGSFCFIIIKCHQCYILTSSKTTQSLLVIFNYRFILLHKILLVLTNRITEWHICLLLFSMHLYSHWIKIITSRFILNTMHY